LIVTCIEKQVPNVNPNGNKTMPETEDIEHKAPSVVAKCEIISLLN
jgi:hypothetical protein